MEDAEIEAIFWQIIDTAKEVLKKGIGIAIIVVGYVREGFKEIYKGEKWE